MKRITMNTLLKVIADVTIGTGAGQFPFVIGQRVRASELASKGITISARYFVEVV